MTPPDDFAPIVGQAVELEPGLRRIVAPNPSPMTYRGTNTYLLGHKDLAVIDPGPLDDAHLQAILDALQPDQRVSHIVVTHTHSDHSPLARPLAESTGARVLAFGAATDGRSDVMRELARAGDIGGGEGIDERFEPDDVIGDGDKVVGLDWELDVIHTPGHLGNHICLGWKDRCFTADHVMGWASSLVSPPDGDLTDFMASCEKLAARQWRVFYAGHGAPIEAPNERLEWLMRHRRSREAAILEQLQHTPANARSLAAEIYTDIPPALQGAAARNVLAHLIDLYGKSRVSTDEALHADTVFHRQS